MALAGFINLGSFLLRAKLDKLFDFCSADVVNIKNELHEMRYSVGRVQHDVLIADHVYGDLRVQPEVIEVLPHSNLLLNEFCPVGGKLGEVSV